MPLSIISMKFTANPSNTLVYHLCQRKMYINDYSLKFITLATGDSFNYSSFISLLTNLLKIKSKSLSWTPSATQAFQKLKTGFTSAPLLVHPDPNKPFVVKVDILTCLSSKWILLNSIYTPFLQEAHPGGAELWYWQQRTLPSSLLKIGDIGCWVLNNHSLC